MVIRAVVNGFDTLHPLVLPIQRQNVIAVDTIESAHLVFEQFEQVIVIALKEKDHTYAYFTDFAACKKFLEGEGEL